MGFNVSSSKKNSIYTTMEKSLIAFPPYIPLRASGSNLGPLAIIMNFSTLVYNIHDVFEVEVFLLTCDSMRCSKEL
jgi:hypothetical protein